MKKEELFKLACNIAAGFASCKGYDCDETGDIIEECVNAVFYHAKKLGIVEEKD